MPRMTRNARDLAVFAFANLLSLGVATLLSALCSLPFAFMGCFVVMLLVSLWFTFPRVSRVMDREFFPHLVHSKVR